ncbi:MAG: heme lyase CcmF/NrfE family subunit [Thermoleophilia bacterium]|nr:heme lyase CcmF/NrfE family subunit [Thermoleophilia bacterium]
MPGLGRAALVIALGLVLYAAIAGAYAALRGRRRLADSAANALVVSFVATAAAAAVLLGAFLTDDLSLTYVANHSSRDLPRGYAFSAFWGGQEGSLLLWLLVLTGMSAAAVVLNRRLVREVLPWTVPILAGVAVFFALVLVLVSSPFATQPAPADGLGLNPSLQNPYMIAHPPLLYLGYVGLTIPFAFAMAALASRRIDERWIVATRRWTLGAWAFLGIGILVGAKWAYEEIGWGGWYAWDPVENAALMPWLVATAFLHSVMVQEKKNMLRVWNVVLVALAFGLSLFGTFLTRSGVVNSIHSFAESPIGAWFLGFICLVVAGSIALILSRLPLLRAPTRMESLVSREAAFLYNNLFFVAFALTVLWGVAYPLVSEAVRGVAATVGSPYYNFFAIVFGLPLVFLMAVGPLVAWRRASTRALVRAVAWPAAAAIASGVALLATGSGSSPVGLVGYTFAIFVLAAIALEFVRGTRARKALGGTGWVDAFASLVSRNRRRYGGYVVHASIALLVIGAVGIGAFGSSREGRLAPGEELEVDGYVLRYLGSSERQAANAVELRARIEVSRGGEVLGVLQPGKNRYLAEQQTSNEVAIRPDWPGGEDLFLIAEEFGEGGTLYLKALVNPLVNVIWLAGVVFVLGSLLAMWPDAREQRRLAQRFADPEAYARTG